MNLLEQVFCAFGFHKWVSNWTRISNHRIKTHYICVRSLCHATKKRIIRV